MPVMMSWLLVALVVLAQAAPNKAVETKHLTLTTSASAGAVAPGKKASLWIDVEPKQVHIRSMTRKWGSCSTAGRLTLDEGLTRQPAAFRREVIVHELLHLKVPNHGKLFKALLKAYLGTCQA